ncbi:MULTISPECIES: porin family protein [unclassified Flavobacterium]|uniref:porin family protein n=1 Tax=unclassified Flavobacterium TaxID=196869 RepID=UPI00360A63EC
MKNAKKTVAILTLITLFSSFNTKAQVATEPSMGLKGGVNFSNMYVEDVDDENMLVGFNLGLYANMPLSSGIALQPEFNFTTKGSEVTYNNIFDSGTRKFTLSYLEVPVLLKANLSNNFNLHFGPYFAFLVNSKIKNVSSDGSATFTDLDEDDFNRFDFGLSGGIGFDFSDIGIGLRYNYGLTTVGKEQQIGGATYNALDAKNSNANLYVAFKF